MLAQVTLAIAVPCGACSGTGTELSTGDSVPLAIVRPSDGVTVVLAATLDDCLGCTLPGVFVAIRAMQRNGGVDGTPDVVVLAVTRSPQDTLVFRRTLNVQRLTARIKRIAPQAARKLLNESALPAMYLVSHGRGVRVWQPAVHGGTVSIGRTELLEAAANIVE